MNIKTVLKSSVAAAALFAVAVPMSTAQAADDTFKSGNKNSLKISGQVVRSLFWADDGTNDALFNSGGKVTGSRVRWIASGKLNENVTVGSTIEMNTPISNTQGSLTLQGATGVGNSGTETGADGTWQIRQSYVWVNHKKMGKLTLGNTDGASNGHAEGNFIAISGEDTNGITNGTGLVFINKTSGAVTATQGPAISALVSNFDGASRTDVLKYTTPKFMGFGAGISLQAGGAWDAGLAYSGKFGPVKVLAKVLINETSATTPSSNFTTAGSFAALHDSGLNINFAIGKRNFNGPQSKGTVTESGTAGTVSGSRDDPHFIYYGLGYQAKIFNVGKTHFGLTLQQTDDLRKNTSEFEAVTVSAEQNFSSIGAKVMLQYSNMSLDEKSAGVAQSFDDIDVFTVQTIFTF